MSVYLGLLDHAVACQQQAIQRVPEDFQKRKTLAALLVQSGRYDEAFTQLQWCLWRRPDDVQVHELLDQAKRKLQASPASSTARASVETSALR